MEISSAVAVKNRSGLILGCWMHGVVPGGCGVDGRLLGPSWHLSLVQGLPYLSCVRAGEGAFTHPWLSAGAAAASRGALSAEIPLSEHVQLLRNRTSGAVGRTSSYSLVLAWTQWGLGARTGWELPCCFLGQPLNIPGDSCDNRCRKLWFERSLPSDILFAPFIREGSNSGARGPS